MANYHLHSMSIFLNYQIRFPCALARVLALKYKSAFSVLHMHMPNFFFFKTLYTIKHLGDRPVSMCKVKFAKKRQESRLGTRSSDVSKGTITLYRAVDAIAAVACMLYFAKARWPD